MEKPIVELEQGELFKFNSKQKKWRVFKHSRQLPDRPGILERHEGKLLVIYDACKQAVVFPNENVIIQS